MCHTSHCNLGSHHHMRATASTQWFSGNSWQVKLLFSFLTPACVLENKLFFLSFLHQFFPHKIIVNIDQSPSNASPVVSVGRTNHGSIRPHGGTIHSPEVIQGPILPTYRPLLPRKTPRFPCAEYSEYSVHTVSGLFDSLDDLTLTILRPLPVGYLVVRPH